MSKKYDYVLQQNNTDCGIASIMTILMYYGIRPSREKILSKVHKNRDGYTAYDLIKISKYYKVESYGIKSNISNIKNFPVVAHTIKDENMFHFIVVLEYNPKKKLLKIMDPAYGIKTITQEEFDKITTNIYLIFDRKKKKKVKDKRFKREILKIFKTNKKIILKTILFSIIFVLLSLVFNYYLKTILSYSNSIYYVLYIFVFFLVVVLLKDIVDYIKNKLIINLNTKIDKDITNKVTSHILNLPYKYFITKPSGELVTIIEDIENFKEIVTKVFVLSLVDFILIIVIIIYTCILNIYVGLLFVLILIINCIITKKFQFILNQAFIRFKETKINYTSFLYSYLSSYETIKNLNISKKIATVINNKYDEALKYDKEYNNKNNIYSLLIALLTDIFYIIVIFLSVNIAIRNNIELLDIVLFSSIFYLVIGFMGNISESMLLYKIFNTSSYRILDCLDVEEEPQNQTKFLKIDNIRFHRVSYHNNDKLLLKDINLTINKNDRVYITGESGIGKSTMMKILLRHYKLSRGKILIDGININDIELSFIRDNITYISQNETLFQGTIKDNLSLVSEDDKKIKEVLDLTLVTQFLNNNNISLNFLIEEDGSNLSGGERKKIVLARGLLHFKNVLILDEVFNEISIKEERIILKNIMDKYPDKIIIMVSHRDSNKDLFNVEYQLKGDGGLYEIK